MLKLSKICWKFSFEGVFPSISIGKILNLIFLSDESEINKLIWKNKLKFSKDPVCKMGIFFEEEIEKLSSKTINKLFLWEILFNKFSFKFDLSIKTIGM